MPAATETRTATAPDDPAPARRGKLEPLAAKVPEITVIFWLVKVLTTGMGEAASDFLGQQSVPLAGAIGVFGLFFALRAQLRTREYRARVYWTAVLMVAVFGTMVADGLRDGAGISYGVTTAFYSVVVAVIFALWHRSEGTLSIHTITTRRREAFYWSAVLATFALGTAAGDLTALSLGIGFFGSALLFAAVMAVPALLWWRANLNAVLTFWACYVLTRPLGASVADWFGKPAKVTGLGLGDGTVTAACLVAFIALVAWIARTKRDIQAPERAHAHHPRHRAGLPQVQPAEG